MFPVSLVTQDWVLRRHISDLGLPKNLTDFNLLKLRWLTNSSYHKWFNLFSMFAFCLFVCFAQLLLQIMALQRQTNTSGGCPASHSDCFVCLCCKHCIRKERPKGEMTCSKSHNQVLDSLSWNSISCAPAIKLQFAASFDAFLWCLEFSYSSGSTGVHNTIFAHEYFLLNKGEIAASEMKLITRYEM